MRWTWLWVGLLAAACAGSEGPADETDETDASETDGAESDDTETDDTEVEEPDPDDVDDDSDGFTENQGDCDDESTAVSPDVAEICDNGKDDDCDGDVDDLGSATVEVGPLPYLQATDSPWSAETLTNFVLEDMEDQALPAGVTASTFTWSSSFGASYVDSVDGDDGDATNGLCPTCDAMWSGSAITFTFDPVVLGGLPTHVGIVVTDAGSANVTATLSAQSTCASFGTLSSSITFGDGAIGGETAEDRFVGFVSPAGVVSFTVSLGTAMEVDHLQFGW